MTVQIKRCTVDEFEHSIGFRQLLDEYSEESSLEGLPPAAAKLASYKTLENSGMFAGYGAYDNDILVGLVTIITPVIPHYGVSVAVTESIFAAKAYRKTGVGLMLIRTAEQHARDSGCPAIMISAPVEGPLTEVLPRIKYRETNRVFMKSFLNG